MHGYVLYILHHLNSGYARISEPLQIRPFYFMFYSNEFTTNIYETFYFNSDKTVKCYKLKKVYN